MLSHKPIEIKTNARKCFLVKGKVQNVMFRQTIMRYAQRHGLLAGATNEKVPEKNLVSVTFEGAPDVCELAFADLEKFMKEEKPLNSWGAQIEELQLVDDKSGKAFSEHEVSTENVDKIKWNPNVKMHF